MKKNSNENEKYQGATSMKFIKLDESFSENKESNNFEMGTAKLDLNINFDKDDIAIEDDNDCKKANVKNDTKENKIKIANKSEKKNINSQKDYTKNFNKISDNNNVNNANNKLVNYSSNENIKTSNSVDVHNMKNKYDLSFNNLVYDTLDESVCDTLVNYLINKINLFLLNRKEI